MFLCLFLRCCDGVLCWGVEVLLAMYVKFVVSALFQDIFIVFFGFVECFFAL